MKDLEHSEPENNFTEELKRIIIFLSRIYNGDTRYCSTFINTLALVRYSTEPKNVFYPDYNEELISPKNILSILKQNGYLDAEKNELNFQDSDEKYFYYSLPNDYNLLLDEIYFLLLPESKQKIFFSSIVNSLIYSYKEECRGSKSKQEKSLLKQFRCLSKSRRNQVLDFISFLIQKQDEKFPKKDSVFFDQED